MIHLGLLWLALWAGQGQAIPCGKGTAHCFEMLGQDGKPIMQCGDHDSPNGKPGCRITPPAVAAPKPEPARDTSVVPDHGCYFQEGDGAKREIPCTYIVPEAKPEPAPNTHQVTCTHNQERCGTSTQCESLHWTIMEPAYCDDIPIYTADTPPFPSKVLETASCEYIEGGYVKGIKQDQVICPWTHMPAGWKRSKAKPEPSVVPAIRLKDYVITAETDEPYYAKGFSKCAGKLGENKQGLLTCSYEHWSCSDKSRVLLQTEDGKRICVKFPE